MLGVLALGACASSGDIDNPAERRLSWYSHLNGDDIRAACQPGAPDHLRAIFNGVYSEEVRLYEIRTLGEDRSLSSRVIGPADLTTLAKVGGLSSLFDPWRGTSRVHALDGEGWASLREALKADGLGEAPPEGLEVRSDRFYWVVVGCLDGAMVFNAWADPSDRFAALTFDDVLVALDKPENPLPRYEKAMRGSLEAQRRQDFLFRLRVGPKGLIDGAPIGGTVPGLGS
ncbi:MAG: hypothetical protein K9H25_19785 [Rhodospirillum sp.]|nr:hypothetical protein [Rhodospirillum sp.]MCF8491596.1 hypothetical protein [Rhodospirillum sp.]MCF8499505.1 hypothetical protein [Rhodospirillum sp.]